MAEQPCVYNKTWFYNVLAKLSIGPLGLDQFQPGLTAWVTPVWRIIIRRRILTQQTLYLLNICKTTLTEHFFNRSGNGQTLFRTDLAGRATPAICLSSGSLETVNNQLNTFDLRQRDKKHSVTTPTSVQFKLG